MSFGSRIKACLVEKGMNVPELSQKSGVSQNTLYSYIRRDTQKIDPPILQKIANALGVDLYYFLENKEQEETQENKMLALKSEPEMEEFIGLFSLLDAEKRKMMLDLLRTLVEGQVQVDVHRQ